MGVVVGVGVMVWMGVMVMMVAKHISSMSSCLCSHMGMVSPVLKVYGFPDVTMQGLIDGSVMKTLFFHMCSSLLPYGLVVLAVTAHRSSIDN